MIELQRVSRLYESGRGVSEISFRVDKGEWVLLVGGSGAGKSTILRLVYGALRPDSGEMIVGPHRLSQLKDFELYRVRRMLGILDEDLGLVGDRSVYRNVALVGEVLGWSAKQRKRQALKVLHRVGLHAHLEQYPAQLSRGEQRRLAIARALVAQPFALVADEPLIHLDAETAGTIVELFAQIHSQGTAILLATHRRELFAGYPIREVRVNQGRLEEA